MRKAWEIAKAIGFVWLCILAIPAALWFGLWISEPVAEPMPEPSKVSAPAHFQVTPSEMRELLTYVQMTTV
jgi:hypothetical protein